MVNIDWHNITVDEFFFFFGSVFEFLKTQSNSTNLEDAVGLNESSLPNYSKLHADVEK